MKNDKMELVFNKSLAENYKSNSQKVRVMSESWTEKNIFCANCGGDIFQPKNNTPFLDFYCKKCSEKFELKSSKNKFQRKLLMGAYKIVIEKIKNKEKPNLFLLNYLETLSVNNFFVIPKYFIVKEIIEKRKKLSEKARRKGFIGANFLLHEIPDLAKIYYVKDEEIFPKEEVLKNWKKTLFFKKVKRVESKGWILDVLNCVEKLDKTFTLEEIYKFEGYLKLIHPDNKNIRAKVRQQLQFLRNKGVLKFLGNGKYKKI